MRLGCEATAIDINPVAWFILKCTLEYPQRLAGQVRPLPKFALDSPAFMEGFFKGTGVKGQRQLAKNLESVQQGLFPPPDVDLAWHVRAWGWRVLQKTRADLERFYPVVDGKPAIAYLWARTATCKNCRATVPLLKTRWVAKTDSQRVLLTISPRPDRSGVSFTLQNNVPRSGGNRTQSREHDKRLSLATMTRSGARCPCCGSIMTKEDLQFEGKAGRLGQVMVTVAVEGARRKEFRLPTEEDMRAAELAAQFARSAGQDIPFGLPEERIVEDAKGNTWCVQYGVDQFQKLFTGRQLAALVTLVKHTRAAFGEMRAMAYPPEFAEAITAYLACAISRLADFFNCGAQWKLDRATINHLFVRYAIPISWDFAEGNVLSGFPGGYEICCEKIAVALHSYAQWDLGRTAPSVLRMSSAQLKGDGLLDAIVTDPPYYNAIGYSVVMDYFYVWLRRILHAVSPELDEAFQDPLAPKWDTQKADGELVDDASRHDGDAGKSKAAYEDGMARVFENCNRALGADGRLVIVFAHKDPDAWGTLVSAIIRAGFIVDSSWPIQTEQKARLRAQSSAALASSVWLVCKKRPATARPGWDNRVLEEMRSNIYERLRAYWDAGIRGPDFVWAATGPALEAYSKHPIVKKATEAGQTMNVNEFLRAVRRIVVDFVVGRVLTHDGEASAVSGLDDLTTYYLLHRHDFGLEDAPVGACILYAVSCGLSDTALVDRFDLLARTGGKSSVQEEDGETDDEEEPEEEEAGSGSQVRLKLWSQRKRKGMGYDADGRPAALIDQAHRLMHLWKAGEVTKVDEYIDDRGLRRYPLFHQLLQALIELAGAGSEERALLESISNHVQARGVDRPPEKTLFDADLFPDHEP
jgi:adenine-specific DNA methylase